MRRKIIVVQAIHKRRLAEKLLDDSKNAANKIASIWRRYKSSVAFAQSRDAAIKISSQWRCHLSCVSYRRSVRSESSEIYYSYNAC